MTTWDNERADVKGTLRVLQAGMEQVQKTLNEMRETLAEQVAANGSGLAQIRERCAGRCAQMDALQMDVNELKAGQRRLEKDVPDKLGPRLESVERAVQELTPVIKVVLWIGAALGTSVIALIWALITGRASLAFM